MSNFPPLPPLDVVATLMRLAEVLARHDVHGAIHVVLDRPEALLLLRDERMRRYAITPSSFEPWPTVSGAVARARLDTGYSPVYLHDSQHTETPT